MHKVIRVVALFIAVMSSTHASGQAKETCTAIRGTIVDSTDALLPGAQVSLTNGLTSVTDAGGRFRFRCVNNGTYELRVSMRDFTPKSVHVTAPSPELRISLSPGVHIEVSVGPETGGSSFPTTGVQSATLTGKQLEALADDPDDLKRELGQLAAAGGGSPTGTTVSINGFQGNAPVPPKDSIAFVNINPDMFSAEYHEPPFGGGGRVEIFTKPGAQAFHGALFVTNSSPWMNASNPFSIANHPTGKQRYGGELSGPIRRAGSNFAITLEHRSIDEVAIVNAILPDSMGNPSQQLDTVPTPQYLWEATARVDWQIGRNNIFSAGYQASVNHIENVGVGANVLREAGYQSGLYDHTLRLSDLTTLSPRVVHEARYAIERRGETDIPNAAGPSILVSGYFTGGGATVGNQRVRTWIHEYDDDLIVNTKRHTLKLGTQDLFTLIDDDQTLNFNGTYIFGGASPPSGTPLNPLQQYVNALGSHGAATEFNNVVGQPKTRAFQAIGAFFFEDTYKISDRLTVSYGVRYVIESDPAAYNGLAPRVGLSYSPSAKNSWTIHGHFGLFNDQYSRDDVAELLREDGKSRITNTIYNLPLHQTASALNTIVAFRTQAQGFDLPTTAIGELGITKQLPKGFTINLQETQLRILRDARTVNVNSPFGSDPYGARPLAQNEDILEARCDGTGMGHADSFGVGNQNLKKVQFFLGALHLNIRHNTGSTFSFQPQSSYTDAGETVRSTSQPLWQVFGFATFSLPWKIQVSGDGYAGGGIPFNIITGSDNNGDGSFNDRPQFAVSRAVADGTSTFQTPLGLLTNAGPYPNGVPQRPIPRNLGALPWNFHLDGNIERKWIIGDGSAVHQKALSVNLRSSNVINHTNVTSEGNVLGSPQFLVPIAGDTARRLEIGTHLNF